MRSPWTKKNPFLSMWLSGANATLGSARGKASARVRREANAAIKQSARQTTNAWLAMWALPTTTRKKKKRS